MRTIKHKETLFFYDQVQVFTAVDRIGGNYLCVLTELNRETETYLVVGISAERLRDFKLGSLDLRAVIESREIEDWYFTTIEGNLSAELQLNQQGGEIPEVILPDSGFFLPKIQPDSHSVAFESKVRHNAVLEIWMNPPESATGARIHALKLSGMIAHFQALVKHAYNKAITNLSKSAREILDVRNAHQLDAFAVAPGSFRIFFEASKGPDLFGYVEIQRAFEKLDEITASSEFPLLALENLKENKGHFAGAYIRLLDFIVKNETSFSYQWTTPLMKEVRGRTITQKQAIPLLQELNQAKDLGIEIVKLHGYLRKGDSQNNTWRLESIEDNKVYSGDVTNGVALTNVTLDKAYMFICEEHIEEHTATGKEIRKLYLLEYEEQ